MWNSRSFVVRVGPPSLALVVFYWALFIPPGAASRATDASTGDQTRLALEEARRLVRAHEFSKALEPALRLRDADPNNHAYLRLLAEAYHGAGNFGEEARTWESFMEHAPLPFEACPQIGLAYQKQSKTDEALNAFQRCYELDHRDSDSIFYFALALERKGDYARAEGLYRQGLRLAPDYADLAVGSARCMLHLGKAEQAEKAIKQVLARHPENVDALLVAGLASWRTGDRAGAKTYLEKGAALAPNDGDFRSALTGVRQAEAHP